jgi:excinuclease ABC subunit B
LVAILDADKEGFLRNETSLIQTIGRAARNAQGQVIMYAEHITESMQRAIDETNRRRSLQQAYNEAHGIIPRTIKKEVSEILEISYKEDKKGKSAGKKLKLTEAQRKQEIERLTKEMKAAARMLEFEYAAHLRDEIKKLQGEK